ncbi:MAG TPA: 50S ribosomal protein L3 [Candidatus Peribacteraceae bacterium]|nr:50S ribosomal protein L3 [Candidatus Peribacteraceae bacterium]
MAAGLIAHKIGMSRIFAKGEAIPVTYLKIEPNTVVRFKTVEKDGYNAIVLGVGREDWKSRKGKANVRYKKMKEWKVDKLDGIEAGSQFTAAMVPTTVATVTIMGVSKGKGFQGVIKRHKFSSGPSSHGSHHHRRPGSIGMRELPGRVHKGKRMAGRMGTDQITIKNRAVIAADAEAGIIAVKGPIPGPAGAAVYVTFEFKPDLATSSSRKDSKDSEATKDSEESSVSSASSESSASLSAPAEAK